MPVALYGMPYDCERIMAIANKYGIKPLRVFSSSLQAIVQKRFCPLVLLRSSVPVVEDAAEGMGSRFDGQVLGWMNADMPAWLAQVDRFEKVCEDIENSPEGLKVR